MADEPTIKAIPTRYKGYTFRSRLEARWAVFFDALGEPWDYEREGFDLVYYDCDDTGTRVERHLWYLPDFWLPRWDAYVEIKPRGPLDEDAEEKAAVLAVRSHKQVLVICGNPWRGEYEAWLPNYGSEMGPGELRFSDPAGDVWLQSTEPHLWLMRLNLHMDSWQGQRPVFRVTELSQAWLMKAYEAGRSARFERR